MLIVENISKVFNKGSLDEKKALSGLSLHINKGDFATIIGSNGAGKSTLFNAIAGTFYVDEGRIILDGNDITYMADHKRAKTIGRLFQDPMKGTAPGMTIEENMALAYGKGGLLSRISNADRELFKEKLEPLGMNLENRMSAKAGLLSGGQRQALSLVMATINPPKLLLLDEHTAALDPATAEKVLTLTKEVVEKDGLTCLMITHSMKSALELGNRTLMMENGNVIFDVSGEERSHLGVNDLIEKFKNVSGKSLTNDRMLLS